MSRLITRLIVSVIFRRNKNFDTELVISAFLTYSSNLSYSCFANDKQKQIKYIYFVYSNANAIELNEEATSK